MLAALGIALELGLIGLWLGCGQGAAVVLREKGYLRGADGLAELTRGAQERDSVSRGSQLAPSAFSALLPFIGGPLALLVVALLPVRAAAPRSK